ncbi:hypothetical protein CTAYLR_000912 [Chrysophaeum taylorii]|uniref:AB hydrolase-1 domain-containing protein n=1 Tax=Chrysophaeum taylorii TaxID=2483200 RepID=A0AAD7UH13_9STRA|nr:hypothetical protein CTAYLR_000912 [Chrysophaeum taylorii]
MYTHRAVSYVVEGTKVAGVLFEPAVKKATTGIVVLGPIGYVKEQSPMQYASRLAIQGFTTLIFDPRGHGESEGEPRRVEDPDAKCAEVIAAAKYLESSCAEVYGLGICQGVNWMTKAVVSEGSPLSKVALVAGNYLTPQVNAIMTGGNLEKRLAEADAALAAFEKDGTLTYRPIVPGGPDDMVPFLPRAEIGTWYNEWDTTASARSSFQRFRGKWENRLAIHSEAKLWRHDVTQDFHRLTKPTLLIHSDAAATGPKVPRVLFDAIAAENKTLVWLPDGESQFMFYEHPLTIDTCVSHVVDFFSRV